MSGVPGSRGAQGQGYTMREGCSPLPNSVSSHPNTSLEDPRPSTSAMALEELDSPRRHGKLQRKGTETRDASTVLAPTSQPKEGSTSMEAFRLSLEDLRVAVLQNLKSMNRRLEAQNRRLCALEEWRADSEAHRNSLP
ncbi:hypothetical protein L345_07261 [Ophiophagus hannah]|uniref:Uncharacterized protein n=1 Tax=Ophiophagus hannah TaxID=8665 RepID=V8NYD5_OPHHA|nr:hypothetical protein L345_07261 [Ophiophagus hannah]